MPPAGFPPLTARSVLLSVLLGSHPPELAVRSLVRAAALFGVSEGTTRVALSRLVSEGDAIAAGGRYRLSARLLQRQRDQDTLVRPATRRWRGDWELVIADPNRSAAAERSGLGPDLRRLGLAELSGGVWGRPNNLVRDWPAGVESLTIRFIGRFTGRPERPAELVGALWDLTGWAAAAETLMSTMSEAAEPAARFAVAAAMVRHLRTDPVLPPALLPPRWPGPRLRQAYSRYRRELGALLAEVSGPGAQDVRADDSARHKAV